MNRRKFLWGAASSIAMPGIARAQAGGCTSGCLPSSMTLDFVNNIYERNGIIYPSLNSLMSSSGGSFGRSLLGAPRTTHAGMPVSGASLTLSVPSGATQAVITYGDNSTQLVTNLSGKWDVPAKPGADYIKSISFSRTALVDTNMSSLGKSGAYSTFLGMWGMADQKIGTAYTAGARYDKASINRDIIFGWRLPLNWNGGVRGYLQISYGNYNDNNPLVQVPPLRASELNKLEATVDYQAVGDPFSLLFEWFLTKTPHVTGGFDDIVGEIGALPHVSAETISWMNRQTQLGKMVDRYGRSWTVARAADSNYTTFRPTDGQDVKGPISGKDMMDFVLSKGVNVGSTFINGVAFGPEPRLGNGATKISMTVDAYG